MLQRTIFGRQLLAIGGNAEAARLSGVPVDRIKQAVYALSGICAGIAGLIVIAINSSSDANLVGLGMELDAIAAVAVGGTPLLGGAGLPTRNFGRSPHYPADTLHLVGERWSRRF